MADENTLIFDGETSKFELALTKLTARIGSLEQTFGRAGKASKAASKEASEATDQQSKEVQELIDLVGIQVQAEESAAAKRQAAARQVAAEVAKETQAERELAATRHAALQRGAAQVKARAESPLDTYRREAADFAAMRERNLITEQEFAHAIEQSTRKFYENTGAMKASEKAAREREQAETKAAQAEKRSAEELDHIAASARKLIATPLEQWWAKERELTRAVAAGKLTVEEKSRAMEAYRQELMGVVTETEKAGRSQLQSFGGQALSMITSYLIGLASIQAAVHKIAQAWNEENEAAKQALETSRQMNEPNKDLAQLGDGSPGSVKRLYDRRDALATKFGIDRKETSDTMFAVQSAALSESQAEIAMRAGLIGDASDTAQFMGTIKSIYGDEISPEAGVNVAIRAAADSPKLNFKDFVGHMPGSMNFAKELGLSMEETSAIIGKMSTRMGTPEEAFDRFSMLAGRMSTDDRFRGKGLAGFESLTKMSDEELQDFLGDRKEAKQAFNAIRDEWSGISPYAKELEKVSAATGGKDDELNKLVGSKLDVPAEMAKFKAAQAKIRAEVAAERNLAEGEAAREQAVNEEAARIEEEEMGWGERAGTKWGAEGAKKLRLSPEQIRDAGTAGEAAGLSVQQGGAITMKQIEEIRNRAAQRELERPQGMGAENEKARHDALGTDYAQPKVDPQMAENNTLLKDIRDALNNMVPSQSVIPGRPPRGPNPHPSTAL